MSEDDRIWNDLREHVRGEVTDVTFQLWLAPLELLRRDGATLYVTAPQHVQSLVEERYLSLLRGAARRVFSPRAVVELVGAGTASGEHEVASPARTHPPLNPRYTFDQFVIGDSNRLAHAAALSAAEQPGHAYNPLFIHGPPGVGKTHLLHAIGNYAREHGGGISVRYATVEEFTSEFVQAVRGGDSSAFRQRFRGADVLLLDDVQFLAEKVGTKQELFHTFNALYESGRQVVFTSDRAPADLDDFEARLRERFQCGLVADLAAPGLAARIAILRKRVALDGAQIDVGTLEEIARQITSSVRALEGALVRVIAYASLSGQPPSPALAHDLLARLHNPVTKPCSLDAVQRATAAAFELTQADLVAQDRRPRVALARQVAMYLSREMTGASFPAIGAAFGGRNHSTVLHACAKIQRALQQPGEEAQLVHRLHSELRRAR